MTIHHPARPYRARPVPRAVAIGVVLLALALVPWRFAPTGTTGAAPAPVLTATPDRGPCGSRVAIRGAGFPPGEPIDLVARRAAPTPRRGSQIAVARAGADGAFTVELTLAGCGDDPDGAAIAIVAQRRPTDPRDNGDVLASAVFTIASAPRCFAEAGHCVQGRFLAYWEQNGGLARNGYPISDERREVLEDGREYTVQYFERTRLEYHPENAPPHDVLLGQFGRRVLLTQQAGIHPPVARNADPTGTYFPETGHNLGEPFRAHWEANGGLARFGYPLTEVFRDALEDGNFYEVQYFERARLEHHPEHAGTPHEVLLGQFGRIILYDTTLLAGEARFHLLYLTTPRAQELLGRPSAPAARAPGAFQAFERGAMVWRGDARQIYALCGGPERGQVLGPFADTWREGQEPGGGPGPGPGLHAPGRGFGTVWRERAEVRACLGYALDAEERGYTLAAQPFRVVAGEPNLLLSAETPEGRFIYALYNDSNGGPCRPGPCRAAYERFPDPWR